MNKNIVWIFIGCALAAGFFLRGCTIQPDTPKIDPVIDSLKRANRVLEAERAVILERWRIDTVKAIQSRQQFQTEAAAKDRTIAALKARPSVVMVREEHADIDTLIIAYDSALAHRDERLAATEMERHTERRTTSILIANGEARNANLTGINTSLTAANNHLIRVNKNQANWNKVWKIFVPVSYAAGVYTGFKLAR